jgi:hypothetical protein
MDHITPLDKLEAEALVIDKFLNERISDIPSLLDERIIKLGNYNARIGKMVADAQYHLDEAKKSEVIETLITVAEKTPHATSKAINALIDSICKKERYIHKWCERLNSSTVHQIEICRTLISKAKTERIYTPSRESKF